MVEPIFSKNVYLTPWLAALGVHAAVGHDVRGDANGRQNWPVAPDPEVAARGVRKS
jgi:hypothetical protein